MRCISLESRLIFCHDSALNVFHFHEISRVYFKSGGNWEALNRGPHNNNENQTKTRALFISKNYYYYYFYYSKTPTKLKKSIISQKKGKINK